MAILIGVIAFRITFTSKQVIVSRKVSFHIETNGVIMRMSEEIRIPTISNAQTIDYTQFTLFREFLEKSFPLVHANLERQIDNQYNLIFIWKGSNPKLKPVLFVSHFDVFDITDKGWKYPPPFPVM